jgi:hypothetical protein
MGNQPRGLKGLLSKFPGGWKGAGLGLAMAAPFAFPKLGVPDTPEDLRAQSPDIDLGDIRGRVQAAYQEGPDAVAALQQEFPYLLPYGSAKLAEGGRIGYQDAGPVGSNEAQDAWADLEAGTNEPIGEGETFFEAQTGLGGEDPAFSRQVDDEIQKRQAAYEWDGQGDYQLALDKIAIQTKAEMWGKKKLGQAQGGRIGAQEGGLMDLGGMEKDYRQEGGFVPLGGEEKADDVPARLSKNEFVFTADAVRSAGGGDIDQGAEVMENVMENLEQGGQISEESQGLEGARDMFATSERLSEVV